MLDVIAISLTVIIGETLWLKVIKPWLDNRPPREAFVRPKEYKDKKVK